MAFRFMRKSASNLRRLTPARIVGLYAVFALAWILISGYLLLISVSDPMLVRAIEILKGALFVAVTSGLLLILLNNGWQTDAARPPDGETDTGSRPNIVSGLAMAAVFAVLLFLVPLLGFLIVQIYGPEAEEAAYADLRAVAELKVGQIGNWIRERHADGTSIADDAGFVSDMQVLMRRADSVTRRRLDARIKGVLDAYGYDRVQLFDNAGRMLSSRGARQATVSPAVMTGIHSAISSGQLQTLDILPDSDGRIVLDFVIPILDRSGEKPVSIGTVVLTMLPDKFLIPFITRWQGFGRSGETLLVRPKGDEVEFFTPLGHKLEVSKPYSIADSTLPAAQALRSDKPGVIAGIDYRGTRVLAAYEPVPGTSWRLVAKIDRAEVLSSLHTLVFWICAVSFFAILVSGAALFMLWRKRLLVNQMSMQARTDRVLRNFYDLPFVGMATACPRTGTLLHVNNRLCDILGYSRSELTGVNWQKISHPDDLVMELPLYDSLLHGQSEGYSMEKRFVRKDGSIVVTRLDTKSVRLADGSVDFLAATVQDITEQKFMQQKLLDSEANYRMLADSGQALIWRAGTDGLYFYFNKVWLAFTGRTLEQERGNGWTEGVHPDDLDKCMNTYVAAFDRREAFSMDYRLRCHDGEYRWIQDDGCPCFDHSGTFIGYIGNCLDITDRFHTRQAMAESEAKMRAVVSNLPVVLSTVGSDGFFTMSEGKALEQIGYQPGEMVGQHITHIYKDDRMMLPAISRAMRGECLSIEHELGGVLFESFLEPFMVAGEDRGVMITCINITERRRAEEILRMNVKRMECLNRIADCKASSTQELLDFSLQEILAANGSEFGYIYRYEEETQEFVLNSWSRGVMDACMVVSPQTRYALEKTGFWGEVVRQRKPVVNNDFIVDHGLKKGVPEGHVVIRRFMSVPVIVGDRIVAVLGLANREKAYDDEDVQQMLLLMDSVWNIVEQWRAREALQRVTEQLKVSQSLAQVGGWEVDIVSQAVFWTDETYRIHELTPGGFTPALDTAIEFYTEEARATLTAAMADTASSGIGFDLELDLMTAKGNLRQVHTRCQAYREGDRVTRIVGAFQDITAYKAIENELREHQEHLEDLVLLRTRELVDALDTAERATKAKSAFLANMSHEIRTPINAVLGMSHLALRTRLTAKQKEYLDKIMISANMLLGVINDILDFSKIEAGRLELTPSEFVLGDVLDKVIAVVGLKAADKHLEFLVRNAPDVPKVLNGDPVRLGQILINLCSNAVKFTDAGEIMLSVARVTSGRGAPSQIRFSVRDTGIGMSKELISQLFVPFFQGDVSDTRRFGGSGLGLAICRQLVEMMGGHIWVESEPGHGSEFCFEIPFGMNEESQEIIPKYADGIGGLRALVVDGSEAAREIAFDLLRGFGMVPAMAESAVVASESLGKADAVMPDLLVVDWKENRGAVCRLAELVRSHNRRSRLIVMTLSSEAVNDSLIDMLAPDAEVFKPVTASGLFDAVMSAFGKNLLSRPDAGKPASSPVWSEVLGGHTVLLVEDNAFNQQVARELLESVGLVVEVANNGQEALEKADSGRFDVVLMDVQMPVMDGLEATRRLRAMSHLSGLPILAMTAHAMVDEQHHCIEAGMDDFLGKPIEPTLLYAKLAQWFGQGHKPSIPVTPSVAVVAVAEQAKSGSVLPAAIPGISIISGMHYCNDKEDFYLRMLKEFLRSKTGENLRLRDAVTAGDMSLAKRLAHSMKSVSGAIGAVELSRLSAQIELAIRDSEAALLPGLLDKFDEVLGGVLTGLAGVLKPSARTETVNGVAGCAQALKLARQIQLAIDADIGDAFVVLGALEKAVPSEACRGLVNELGDALNVFDSDKSLAILDKLILALNLEKVSQ